MTDPTTVDRIPLAHSVRYVARGLPDVPNQYGPGILRPSEITLTYRAAPDSGLGRVHAYVAGRIFVDGNELPFLPGGLYGQHYDEGLPNWPDWLTVEARLYDPAVSAVSLPPADQTALRDRIAEALMRWAEGNNAPQYAAMRRPETVRANAYSRADAVLAVLPATTDQTAEFELHGDTEIRAAALHEAASSACSGAVEFNAEAVQAALKNGGSFALIAYVQLAVAEHLRRMADETPAAETEPDRATLLDLVRDFLDPDPCYFDHHGYCQAHGYLGGEPMSCPHGRAKKLLAELEQPAAGARQDGAQPAPCAECGHPKGVHGEGDDPVTPGQCADCPDGEDRHDYRTAAVRQDGAQ